MNDTRKTDAPDSSRRLRGREPEVLPHPREEAVHVPGNRNGTTRRAFLRALGRLTGVLTLGAVTLAATRRPGGAAGARSRAVRCCGRCPALSRCSSPEGLMARDVLGVRPAGPGGPAPGGERPCSRETRSQG